LPLFFCNIFLDYILANIFAMSVSSPKEIKICNNVKVSNHVPRGELDGARGAGDAGGGGGRAKATVDLSLHDRMPVYTPEECWRYRPLFEDEVNQLKARVEAAATNFYPA
jgi:hypothetical protein